ncbi:peptidylprolyl isomerase [Massilia sp. Dwa41.01b]|uniref:peptidylprolyl isomerase n=1 Tax=unclassified Massilia TaxID=2609279 RepID=UPI001601415A|nr:MULTISPECIES: peptidyl-prolyl cis-trans isomerase [unclassified Massilia]QNA89027.1 peptidylprolyl isomerase [Massilia sp. Dwa41.01b]QNA99915.1 peptidylprolyl isomerase [Massilia sp. Se16.2.3]
MTLKPASLLLALTAVVAAPAFAQNAAVVNGKAIPSARVEEAVKQIVAGGRAPDSPELREDIKQQLIFREVVMQEALKGGYDKKPQVKAAVDDARRAILIQALGRDYLTKNPVSEADVKAAYDRYAKETAASKDFHLRHILLATEDEAKAVIAKLKGGAKFEDLVKQSKDTGTAGKGGDLDWQESSFLPPETAAAMAKLPKGGFLDTPVRGPYGFHVFKVDDSRPTVVRKFEEKQQELGNQLVQQKVAAYYGELIKKAKVQ